MNKIAAVVFAMTVSTATCGFAQDTGSSAASQQSGMTASQPAPSQVPELKRRAPEANASQAMPTSITLPQGTDIHVRLSQEISTETAKIREEFTGTIAEPVTVNDVVVIPAGATVRGRVADVTSARRYRGKNTLTLRPDAIVLADGREIAINAMMIDSYDPKAYKVDDEGSISNTARHYSKMAAIGAGAGTAVGAVVGGAGGAIAGGAIGAAIPAARWATRNQPVILEEGTTYWFELTEASHPAASAQQASNVNGPQKPDAE